MKKKTTLLHLHDEDMRQLIYSLYKQENLFFFEIEKTSDKEAKKQFNLEYSKIRTLRTMLSQLWTEHMYFVLKCSDYESES